MTTTEDYTKLIALVRLPTVVRWTVEIRPRRKTIGIEVKPDGTAVITVPPDADPYVVAQHVRDNVSWLTKHCVARAQFTPEHPVKELLSGEGYSLLGTNHRLRLVDEGPPIELENEHRHQCWLHLHRKHAKAATIVGWYREQALAYVTKRAESWAPRTQVTVPFVIGDSGDREHEWGAYRRGRIELHWAVLQLNRSLVDRVIVHMMAHAAAAPERGHGPRWRRLLARWQYEPVDLDRQVARDWRRVWLGDVKT